MTLHNTPRPSMLARVAAVVAAAALVAASCGDSSEVDEVPPATSAAAEPATTSPDPVPEMHPCDLDTAVIVDGFCLADGRWRADDGEGNWIESDGPPTTTVAPAIAAPTAETTPTTPADVECSEGEHADEAGGCHPEHDGGPTTAPTSTVAPATTVAPSTTAPTTTIAPTTTAAPTTTVAPAATAPTTTVAPSTTGPTTTVPTTTVPTTTTVPPTTTVAPDPNDAWERAKTEPVRGTELYPDRDDIPDNVWCELVDEATVNCWYEGGEPESDPADVWVEPYAGYVPPVHPDTEPTTWQSGDWAPRTNDPRDDDHPRPTPAVQTFIDWCAQGTACDWLLFQMVWALDYLGANEACVLAVHYTRAIAAAQTSDGNYNSAGLRERYGWHRCPTVIDPRTPTVTDSFMQQHLPGWDVLLLAPSGESPADRCRAVLPADIELEERRSKGVIRDGLDCDEWGAYIEGSNSRLRSAGVQHVGAAGRGVARTPPRNADPLLPHFLLIPWGGDHDR